jgi:hypothetical protein
MLGRWAGRVMVRAFVVLVVVILVVAAMFSRRRLCASV